jgi:hypothetical protein
VHLITLPVGRQRPARQRKRGNDRRELEAFPYPLWPRSCGAFFNFPGGMLRRYRPTSVTMAPRQKWPGCFRFARWKDLFDLELCPDRPDMLGGVAAYLRKDEGCSSRKECFRREAQEWANSLLELPLYPRSSFLFSGSQCRFSGQTGVSYLRAACAVSVSVRDPIGELGARI